MSGDSTLIALDPVFDGQNFVRPLDFRIQVLRRLINQMLERKENSNVLFLDYRDMEASRMQEVFEFFGMPVYARESALFKQHFLRDSKQPDQHFVPDSKAKRSWLGENEVRQITSSLQEDYHNLTASLNQ